MRQDQLERMQKLAETLADVFLDEAEPENWPGDGILPKNMDSATRGDRYWCKKNAVATVSLIQRVHTLVGLIRLDSGAGGGAAAVNEARGEESSLDNEIATAEKEAKKLMNAAIAEAKKREFDKRTHGKA